MPVNGRHDGHSPRVRCPVPTVPRARCPNAHQWTPRRLRSTPLPSYGARCLNGHQRMPRSLHPASAMPNAHQRTPRRLQPFPLPSYGRDARCPPYHGCDAPMPTKTAALDARATPRRRPCPGTLPHPNNIILSILVLVYLFMYSS
jgi:hypothetical protein